MRACALPLMKRQQQLLPVVHMATLEVSSNGGRQIR
jgi:hypothetical protein